MAPEMLPRVDGVLALLQRIAIEYRPAALASSLGAEDMVLTDMIARHRFGIEIFTLDTRRLHRETLDLAGTIGERYGRAIRFFSPQEKAVSDYVARFGLDGFFDSVEARKRCCEIRKVEPLRRALEGKRAWITGLRRAQSATRATLEVEETDLDHGMKKFNPLAEWSEDEVWSYIRFFGVPYNPLHDQGYPSIGCAPCTRAVAPGEDPRSGRWWWEREGASECGIHFTPDGKVVREKAPA